MAAQSEDPQHAPIQGKAQASLEDAVPAAMNIGVPMLQDFRCLKCGRKLARILERDGRTCIEMPLPEGHIVVSRAQVLCACGAERSFYSVPMSAVRLGIVGAAGLTDSR